MDPQPSSGPSADWSRQSGAATIIWRDPLIICTSSSNTMPLGVGSIFSQRFEDHPATFLIAPSWTIESPGRAETLHKAATSAREQGSGHDFVFLCATEQEQALLSGRGERAVFINHNIFVSERFFKPLEGVTVEFDAIYNARFVPWKRHELADEIPYVLYVGYLLASGSDGDDAQRRLADLLSKPGRSLVNPLRNGLPMRIDAEAINIAYNRAAVGLCLSAVEGAMYASIEYLLAGLPIVSTPSKGGRDVFFDPEYCLTVEPDAQAVADGVAELRARNFPRDHVRAQTLAMLAPQQSQFLALLDEILEKNGSPYRFGDEWPFGETPKLLQWHRLGGLAAELDEIVERHSPTSLSPKQAPPTGIAPL